MTLRFLLEEVGQVEGLRATDEQLGENFLLRRAAGNGIEIMGLLAFRASPVWVFAALADICGFGRQMIPEIAEALREGGTAEVHRVFQDHGAVAARARGQRGPARE